MDAIKVEIDPHAPLPERYLGSTEDGPEYGPVSLIDAIIGAAATQLARSLDEEARARLRDEVIAAQEAGINRHVLEALHEALTTPVPETDQWGGLKHGGATRTMREQIMDVARQQLTFSSLGYRDDRNAFSKIVIEEVGKVVREDLKAELEAARTKVREAVKAQAAELVAKAALGERI